MPLTGRGGYLRSSWLRRHDQLRAGCHFGDRDTADVALWSSWFFGGWSRDALHLERRGTVFVEIAERPWAEGTYTDPGAGLVPGTTYHYRARRRVGGAYSQYSAEASVLFGDTTTLPTLADSLALTDLEPSVEATVGVADTLALTDLDPSVEVALPEIADTISLTDSEPSVEAPVGVADTVSLIDLEPSVEVTLSEIADTVSLTDTVSLVAQFVTDFSEYTSGAQPSDWTERWNPANFAATVAETGLPAGTLSTKALRVTGTLHSWYALTWDLVGSVSGDAEVLARWRHEHTEDIDHPVMLHVCVSGTQSADMNTYAVAGRLLVDRVEMRRVASGVSHVFATPTVTLDRDTWYWTRLQRSGTTIRARVWAHGTSEPTEWTASATDTTHTSGSVGIGRHAPAGTLWSDYFSVGTGGASAPSPPFDKGILADSLTLTDLEPSVEATVGVADTLTLTDAVRPVTSTLPEIADTLTLTDTVAVFEPPPVGGSQATVGAVAVGRGRAAEIAVVDWARPRLGTFRYYRVAYAGRQELEELTTIRPGGRISRNLFTALKEQGSLPCVEPPALGDDLVRIYYVVRDDAGTEARLALATMHAVKPVANYNAAAETAGLTLFSALLTLQQAKLAASLTIPAGTVAVDAAAAICTALGLPVVAAPSARTLGAPASWNAGEARLAVVNWLLDAAGFWSAQVDGWGRVVLAPYEDPRDRAPVWSFRDGADCIYRPEATVETDAWDVPNVCVLTASRPEGALIGSFTNDDPASPFSTVRRGREITLADTVDDAADEADLIARAERRLVQATATTERLSFEHAYAPVMIGDVVRFVWSEYGLDMRAAVQSQELSLTPALPTKTTAKRVWT